MSEWDMLMKKDPLVMKMCDGLRTGLELYCTRRIIPNASRKFRPIPRFTETLTDSQVRIALSIRLTNTCDECL